jgi:hypothetical protein
VSASWLKVGTPGRRRFLSQTLHEDRPLTSCTGWAIGMLVEFGGLAITDPRRYGERGRSLTGVAEVVNGKTQGTSVADWQRSWGVLAPWVVVQSGWKDEGDWFEDIRAGRIIVAIGVLYANLPTAQRRWSPRFTGSHRMVIWNARTYRGKRQVRLVDPLVPRNDWTGEWVYWPDVRRALGAAAVNGRVWSAWVAKGDALQASVTLNRALAPGSTVAVPKGAEVYRLDPDTLRLTKGKPAPKVDAAPADAVVQSASLPKRPPSGPMVHITGGTLAGTYVRATQVRVTEPPTVPAAEAEIRAAYEKGRTDEAARYDPVAGDVFTRDAS